MGAAVEPRIGPLALLVAAGAAMPIPRHHPAYTGGAAAPRSPAAGRRSVLAATIAGLLSLAAISGGAAHYMLTIARPGGASAAAAPALAAIVPLDQPMTGAAQLPETPSVEAVQATEASLSVPIDAAPPRAAKRPRRPSAKFAKLLSAARRKKPATMEIETLALAPVEDPLPAAIFTPAEPFARTPKASR